MAFDLASFQRELSIPTKINTQSSGHMLLYEARLSREDRYSNELGRANVTAELWLKLVWWHAAAKKPRASTVHCYAGVLNHNELTDFAKIINAFLPPDKHLKERVDLKELVALAFGIVEAINNQEIYCYCHIDSKQRIGKKLTRFEITDQPHPKINKAVCNADKTLEWFIPHRHTSEQKFKELAELNRKRWGISFNDEEETDAEET